MVTDYFEIGRLLSGRDLTIFRDHRHAAAVIHVVLARESEYCYVIVRRERRKDLPVFASLLHVGNPGMLRGHLSLLGRHLLLNHGLVATLLEVRLLGRKPALSYRLAAPRPKMFRRARESTLPARAWTACTASSPWWRGEGDSVRTQVHHLLEEQAVSNPERPALTFNDITVDYRTLARRVRALGAGLAGLGVARGDRLAVYLDKRIETVESIFAATSAGLAFVPVNPILKATQVAHVLGDCDVRILVTSR